MKNAIITLVTSLIIRLFSEWILGTKLTEDTHFLIIILVLSRLEIIDSIEASK